MICAISKLKLDLDLGVIAEAREKKTGAPEYEVQDGERPGRSPAKGLSPVVAIIAR